MSEKFDKKKKSSFYLSKTKQEIRNRINDLVKSFSPNIPTVLTLAGAYGKDAKMFASQNARVISVEKDKETFEAQKKELQRVYNSITCFHGDLRDVIAEGKLDHYEFDLVYLDYLGPYTKSKEDTLSYLFENNLLIKNSYLCLTLELAREDTKNFKDTILNDITCQGYPQRYFEDRLGIIKQAVKDTAHEYNRKLKTISMERYRNNDLDNKMYNKNCPPMMLLIMKVIN